MVVEQHAFKYVIQDFSNVYFGGRLTYDELAEADDTPAKLRAAIFQGFLKESSLETTIEDHLTLLKEEDFSYLLYHKLNIKLSRYTELLHTK